MKLAIHIGSFIQDHEINYGGGRVQRHGSIVAEVNGVEQRTPCIKYYADNNWDDPTIELPDLNHEAHP